MIDLTKLNPDEAERLAYAEGFTGVAALYARISEAEHERDTLAEQLESARDTLYQCLPFFEDWKDEDGVYKPRTMKTMIRLIRKELGEG